MTRHTNGHGIYGMGNKNLHTTDGEKYDSERTFRNTPRKRKYTTRKNFQRISYGKLGISKKDVLKLQELAKLKLLTFAKEGTIIYTNTYDYRRYAYLIDFLVCSNNRIYRISKLACKILKKSSVEGYVSAKTQIHYCLFSGSVRPAVVRGEFKEKHMYSVENKIAVEEGYVKMLSKAMFGHDDGYIHQSISQLFAIDTEYVSGDLPVHKIPLHERTDLKVSVQKQLGIYNEQDTTNIPKKRYRLR